MTASLCFDSSLSLSQESPIYSRKGGRVVVYPRRNYSGGHDLEEHWPKLQWEDHQDLGVGRHDRRSDCVVRLLYWNGKQFVPYQPGPSHIVDK